MNINSVKIELTDGLTAAHEMVPERVHPAAYSRLFSDYTLLSGNAYKLKSKMLISNKSTS